MKKKKKRVSIENIALSIALSNDGEHSNQGLR